MVSSRKVLVIDGILFVTAAILINKVARLPVRRGRRQRPIYFIARRPVSCIEGGRARLCVNTGDICLRFALIIATLADDISYCSTGPKG